MLPSDLSELLAISLFTAAMFALVIENLVMLLLVFELISVNSTVSLRPNNLCAEPNCSFLNALLHYTD